MRNPYLLGKKLYLRPLEESDINQRYLNWINNSKVARFLEVNLFPITKIELMAFYKQQKKSKIDIIFAIVAKNKDMHIGNIKLGNINYVHRYADLGIMIGERDFWDRGYGQEAINLLLNYAFNRLNLNKVILGVYGNHRAAIKCYRKIGFKVEGKIRKLLYFEGKYVDKIIMGISKKEFLSSINERKNYSF